MADSILFSVSAECHGQSKSTYHVSKVHT
jgi:hypothetical protein